MHGRKTNQKPSFAVFLAASVVVFFSSLSVADSIGFVPYYIDGTEPSGANESVAVADLPQLGEADASTTFPTHISIPAINLELPVQNPDTRDIGILDRLLQSGPARYVDSARLGERGNVLIFAHSSHLPIVHNQMFRAFNNIPDLKAGDSIAILGSDGKTYLYRVASVRTADADHTTINLSPGASAKLTLVTCDTFTGKSARFILEADFVGTQ